MKKIRFTVQGIKELKEKFEILKQSRPAAVEDLKKARELGDLSENGYYKAARAKLSSIDHQLFRIKFNLKQAVVVKENNNTSVDVGSEIILTDGHNEFRYKIVGDLEANPSEGKISLLSPLGKAIEGKNVLDKVTINTPKGEVTYTINKILL